MNSNFNSSCTNRCIIFHLVIPSSSSDADRDAVGYLGSRLQDGMRPRSRGAPWSRVPDPAKRERRERLLGAKRLNMSGISTLVNDLAEEPLEATSRWKFGDALKQRCSGTVFLCTGLSFHPIVKMVMLIFLHVDFSWRAQSAARKNRHERKMLQTVQEC